MIIIHNTMAMAITYIKTMNANGDKDGDNDSFDDNDANDNS